MINIVLVCQYGASTGMLAENIKKAANNRGIEAVVNAYSIADVKTAANAASVILIGPQLRFQKATIEEYVKDRNISIVDINPVDYGMMNGDAVLDTALDAIKQ